MTKDSTLHISQHPIIKSKLSQLRNAKESSKVFRELTEDISVLLGYEASLQLSVVSNGNAQSSYGVYDSIGLKDKVALVPVLRSGLGFVNGFLNLFPEAPVYHLGIFREKLSLQPVEYYNKLPDESNVDICFVLDPVIATGNTAIATINILKEWGMKGEQIKFVALIASNEGISQLQKSHPDIHIYVAGVDDKLDSHGYIVPGVGDSGDRLWNTGN